MTPDLLTRAGQALYGAQWQTALAETLDLNPRRVREWKSGTRSIAPGIVAEIAKLLHDRAGTLAAEVAAIVDRIDSLPTLADEVQALVDDSHGHISADSNADAATTDMTSLTFFDAEAAGYAIRLHVPPWAEAVAREIASLARRGVGDQGYRLPTTRVERLLRDAAAAAGVRNPHQLPREGCAAIIERYNDQLFAALRQIGGGYYNQDQIDALNLSEHPLAEELRCRYYWGYGAQFTTIGTLSEALRLASRGEIYKPGCYGGVRIELGTGWWPFPRHKDCAEVSPLTYARRVLDACLI